MLSQFGRFIVRSCVTAAILAGCGLLPYAQGGTSPIAILSDTYDIPENCSVDPTTGKLATVGYPYHGVANGVAIYEKARGAVISGSVDFAELPKGSTTFRKITLNQSFRAAGGIQWDGKHLAVGDFYEAMIYEFDISGKRGTEVGSKPLTASGEIWQFFIDGDRVIVSSWRRSAPCSGLEWSMQDCATARSALLYGPSTLTLRGPKECRLFERFAIPALGSPAPDEGRAE